MSATLHYPKTVLALVSRTRLAGSNIRLETTTITTTTTKTTTIIIITIVIKTIKIHTVKITVWQMLDRRNTYWGHNSHSIIFNENITKLKFILGKNDSI